ncbi:unnamed protein product [Sympodiomycopsis kandeliae]
MEDQSQPQPTRTTLLSTYWRDPEYLTYIPLTSNTALDYFSRSTFFDTSSTNEILRMQNIATNNGAPPLNKSPREQENELRRFKGIEFVLVHSASSTQQSKEESSQQPIAAGRGGFQHVAEGTCFVVQKRQRDSPIQTQVLETYYILNGNVHMAPDLETVLQNRLTNSLHTLRQSLSIARDNQDRPILPPSASMTQKNSAKSAKTPQGGTAKADTTSATTTTTTTLGAQAAAESGQKQSQVGTMGADDDDEDADLDDVEV